MQAVVWTDNSIAQIAGEDCLIYYGFSLEATTAAVLYVRDGSDAGTILECIRLAAGESAREYYEDGVPAPLGVFMDYVSGTIAGSVRVSLITEPD